VAAGAKLCLLVFVLVLPVQAALFYMLLLSFIFDLIMYFRSKRLQYKEQGNL
jgi:hypothetical protein